DWKSLCAYDSITLVLTDPVIRELDHQKGGQGRLAKRARAANTLIRRLLTEDVIQVTTEKQVPTVVIVSGEAHKPLPDLSGELDYSIPDDRLIGTVAGYQQAHTDRDVAVLSHDTGPLMSAKRLGVPYLQVPDDWLLQTETDEE